MAKETGRSVMVVARESFALTLYTLWHLQQLEASQQFGETMRQHDLASLISFAFNDPKTLPELRTRFLAHFQPARAVSAADPARIQKLLSDHARVEWTPVDPPT